MMIWKLWPQTTMNLKWNSACQYCNRKATIRRQAGYTRRDVIFVGITVLVLLVVFSMKFVMRIRPAVAWTECPFILRQIGVGYATFAGDHHEQYPAAVSIRDGGWRELLLQPNAGRFCWTNYAVLAESLGLQPRAVICLADNRQPARNFATKGSTNNVENGDFEDNTVVSYFVGVTATKADPRSILGGDRNLGPGTVPDPDFGFSPKNGDGNDVTIKGPVCWSKQMHSKTHPGGAGCILFGDGGSQQTSSQTINQIMDQARTALGTQTNQPGIRLIFP